MDSVDPIEHSMIARVLRAADWGEIGETALLRLRSRDGRNPQELAAMDLDLHLGDKVQKAKYVGTMFDIIAPGYDKFTRVFSFGMDKGWKAALVAEAVKRATEHPTILDLACGTGDFGVELARRMSAHRAVGLDLSPQMLVVASKRVEHEHSILKLAACDMLSLCVNDNSVDVVSIGYGLRNTADVGLALREIARVLKPGGILVNLDFHRPVGSVWRELFLWYMEYAGQLAGWLWHREPKTYGYLSGSIRRYLTIPEFEKHLVQTGFTVEWRKSQLGGAIGLHVARRAI
jgi:demethylmenaquinone methyltransferase/2-methoxy-6-polyprenyl-1,4-benzoquinol methylase